MAELEAEEFPEALSALVRSDRAALVRVAARQGLSMQDALECVQDGLCTFLRMHGHGEIRAPQDEWGRLLAGIVRNAARNRRRLHALSQPHEDAADQQPSDTATADELLIRESEHLRLRVCVAELCESQRAVVLLRLLDEQPGEDVAQSLGISRGHVDVLTHRAKASLRACLRREPAP